MDNPYRISGPAIVSFSGGRTSGFMLHEILRAHGGKLPDDVVVCFANTGKEREETLRFVHECGSRWGVHVRWVEWRKDGGFDEVGFNSASRYGEPFDDLIRNKRHLPNAYMRFCTEILKVKTIEAFGRSLGWSSWKAVVGLRYDEGLRVMRALERNEAGKNIYPVIMPLSKAKATKADVTAFWAANDFDLGLMPHEGNCDLCFLKGKRLLRQIIRNNPSAADWWIAHEKGIGAPFGKYGEATYADMKRQVLTQIDMFDDPIGDDEHDVECGLHCAGEAA